MRVKERHISGAIVDVTGKDEARVLRFVRQWRRDVDAKTTVEVSDEEPSEQHEVESRIGFGLP